MSVHIIIDGYNLLKSDCWYERAGEGLSASRQRLIEQSACYQMQCQHKVTLVFDAYRQQNPYEQFDIFKGVEIIYSRYGTEADEVIMGLCDQYCQQQVMVVSDDRAIRKHVIGSGLTAVATGAFCKKLLAGQSGSSLQPDDCWDKDEDAYEEQGNSKKGPSHRLSKRKRKQLAKLEKL